MRGKLILLTVAAIAIAGLFFSGIIFAAIPDSNGKTGDQGQPGVGWVDPSITVSYAAPAGSNAFQGSVGSVSLPENLGGVPKGPVASLFHPNPGSLEGCTSWSKMFVSGPGASFSKMTETQDIPLSGGQATFLWGHVYLFQIGAKYAFTFEVYLEGAGCGVAGTVLTTSWTGSITFDGM
jgi:hypothetical protein